MLDVEMPVFGRVEIGPYAGAGPELFEPNSKFLTEGIALTAASSNGTFSILPRLTKSAFIPNIGFSRPEISV